jgi:hypothetical protein
MEGNGTVRTVFRTMVLWEYASPEGSKQQLLRAIGKKGRSNQPLFIAICRRQAQDGDSVDFLVLAVTGFVYACLGFF